MNSNIANCIKPQLDPNILLQEQNGEAISQLALGKAYFNAIHFENNCLSAFKLFSLSAEQGNMEAQFLLANLYALGQGTKQSHVDAYKWYFKAALQGYKKALIRIHNLYQQDKKLHCRGKLNSEEERRIKQPHPRYTVYYYRELNEQRVEDYKLEFSGTIIDYLEKFDKHKSHKCEDPDTQLKLAFLYQYGYGVKKSIPLAIEFYEKAAEKGHRDAQYHLAVIYQQNTNIKFNYRKALRWYRASAINGNIVAQNSLAYFYEKGLSIEVDYKGALYWYTKAANSGNSGAQLNLGRLYRKGQGVEQSFLEAAKWYKLTALQGNIAAQNCLNQIFQARKLNDYSDIETLAEPDCNRILSTMTLRSKLQNDMNRLSCSPKIEKLTKLSQHALMTDGNAMYTIGLKYYNGEDFTQDKDTGFQWIKKAAKAGSQEAELKIAKMYKDGDTVEQDYHESNKWTVKLAKKKNGKAQNNLGILYKNGLGVRKDPLEASKWFIKSADQGNGDALYQFGLLKFDGEGVRKDRELAFKYFYKSAHLKKPDAIFRLGYMYESGECVEKDESKAVGMYESLAKLGYIHAQFRLGRIYEKGSLTKKDLVKALKYYTMAADSGGPSYRNELAIKYLNGVFDDPNFTKAFALIKQAPKNESLIEGTIFKKPVIHFSKISDISKIIEMLILAEERCGEHFAYELGYAYEFGMNYGAVGGHGTARVKWYCSRPTGALECQEQWEKNRYSNSLTALKWYNSGNEKNISSSKNGIYINSEDHEKLFYADYTKAIKWYLFAADKGDYRAHYRLGTIYEKGKGVKKDLKTAFNYYSQAYEKGNGSAAYSLACMYLNGNGVSQELIKAFFLFSEASYMGHADATEMLVPSRISGNLQMLEAVAKLGHVAIQYQLGIFYEKEDYLKSFEWLSLAAQGGVTDAYYRLGLFYEEGRGTDVDYSKAIEYYEKASRKDYQDAVYRLAQLYHYGKAVECDYLKAYNFYTRAAELEHKDAQKILDTIERLIVHSYENSQEDAFRVSSSEIKDTLLLLKSVAKHGNIELQYSLGIFYFRNGDNQDYKEAFLWFKMAADYDHVEATSYLGLLYEKGLGVEQNYSKSFELFHRASEQGSHCGLYRLGIAYHYGYGVDKSIEDALSCYIKAAELGNHKSQFTLGLCYKNGDLVQKDTIKALEWFTNAYHNGNFDVMNSLLELYDDQPYEYYFHEKLFQHLLKIKKEYNNDDFAHSRTTYGRIHFTLGKMYIDGLGTTKDTAKSLFHFVIAYHRCHYSEAKQYLPLEYEENSSKLQNNYMKMLQAYSAISDDIGEAQLYKLGMLYQDGAQIYFVDQNTANISEPIAIVQKDEVMAFKYIQLAAKKDHPEAQYCLGQMYLEGNGVKQNYNEAIKWFNSAAKSMEPENCYKQGMNYYDGIKVERNFEISLIFIKAAAKKNHAEAQAQLTMMSLQNNGIEKNQKDTIKEVQDSVESMNPDDCYHLGMEFYYGTKVDKNYEISSIYLRKAADSNHSKAQAQLGAMYYQGNGVEKDKEESKKLIEKSLVEMNPQECYDIGMKFYKGTNVDKNYEISSVYLRKAADNNHTEAQAQLGAMYYQGRGVEKDKEEAKKFIEKSLVEMSPKECYYKGMRFYERTEVDINYKIALIYLKKAAEKHYSLALAQLGAMCFQGHGAKKNLGEAMKYIDQSLVEMDQYECYYQGMRFYEGLEVDTNYELSLKYLKSAAIKKLGLAQAQIGLMYLQGNGVQKSCTEAMLWIKQSIKELDISVCYKLGMEFHKVAKVDKNYEVSLIYLRKAAEDSSMSRTSIYIPAHTQVQAQAQLGLMYLRGDGVEKNYKEAIKWIERSVKKMWIGHYYCKGMEFYRATEIDRNYECSLLYLKEGAKKGNPHSQAQLAYMYSKGIGVDKDLEQATRWHNRIKNGYPKHDSISLSQIYHYDEGGIQDFSKALEYYQKRLNGSDLRGIGLLYEYGDGVNQDYKKAMEYYKKSAEDDDIGAYYNLGLLYYYGRGMDQSYTDALIYFTKIVRNMFNESVCHVFIQDSRNDILTFDGYVENKYSFQPRSIFLGAAHYYLGWMYKNGYGTAQNNERARAHFRKSFGYGIKHADDFLVQ